MRDVEACGPDNAQRRPPGAVLDVPERRGAADQLRAGEARMRLAMEAGALGLWIWDAEADCVTLENDRAYEIFGLSPADEPVNAARLVSDYLHPDDVAAFERAAATTLETGAPFQFQGRIYRPPDRELRWLELTGRLQPSSEGRPRQILGTTADITVRKQAEERERRAVAEAVAAAEANAKFRTFFEQGSNFAGVMTLDGTVIEANRLCLDACGFSREEVIGKKFWECGWWSRSPALVEMVRTASAQAAEGRLFRQETPYFVADGSERVVDLVLSPVTDESGRVLFVAPTGTDITKRKRAEEELRRLAAGLAEANRNKTEFLATLAHELRNPLAPIRNGLQLMRLATDNPAMMARVRDMMERQIAQMVHLIDDLLDIARITSGKVELKKSRVELNRIVATAVETTLPMIEAVGHQLTVRMPEEPLLLNVDPARLAQVVSNLLNNAAKYTPTGGRIELSAHREGEQVIVAVADTGVGLPAESLSSVFEMFTQVGRNKDRAEGGLGVGLSLVRHLVELHGGTVTAESPGAGKGSTFTLRLPLVAEGGSRHCAADFATSGSGGTAARKFRVLIVDDNTDGAESLSLLLQVCGHTTHVADDGRQALAMAQAFRPEVVFLDIGMPGMNGYEVARALRKIPGLQDVLLVALTGWGAESDRAQAREAGFDRHLTKPVDLAGIESVLSEPALCGVTRQQMK